MGGATAHPTGATLASGDPPVSLNAMGGLESCHLLVEAPRLGLLEPVWLVLASASIATECGQGSGRHSALPHHRGSTLPAVCPVACPGAYSMEDLPAYIGLGNPAHTGAEEAASVAEVEKLEPVAWVEAQNWLEVAVQQRLWGWLTEPG